MQILQVNPMDAHAKEEELQLATASSTRKAVHRDEKGFDMVYIMHEDDGSVWTPGDRVPAVLANNGIEILDGADVEKLLMARLSKTMALTECTCIAEHRQLGRRTSSAFGTFKHQDKLKVGDVMMWLHMELDFDSHMEDYPRFEHRLKSEVLLALGWDPRALAPALEHIQLVEVNRGSIHVNLVLGGVLVGGPPLWTAFALGAAAVVVGVGVGVAYAHADQPVPGRARPREPSPEDRNVRRRVHVPQVPQREDHDTVRRQESNRCCYMPDTLFQTGVGRTAQAHVLQAGDAVMNTRGGFMHVAEKILHEPKMRDLVTLRTAQAELTVTDDHRIPVPLNEGRVGIRVARELDRGDRVYCGAREAELTNVLRHRRRTRVVELHFEPDEAAETWNAPRWGIRAMGAERGDEP
mmetsp:Transcript_32841/g.76980  ORF Transcript_32841/g.76980 Transcript_32841/m.76980 type:complete len:409 (-) Transcript_32841:151-1377(-)